MGTTADLWRRLKAVPYPGYSRDIVSFGLVREVRVEGDAARIVLGIGHLDEATVTAVVDAVRSASAAAGMASTTIEVVRPEEGRRRFTRSASGEGRQIPRGSIERIVAVASGKGGVGKSTLAVNLAVALAGRGLRTGLLDADAYGP